MGSIINDKHKDSLLFFLWVLWLILLIVISYKTRYWISNDAIGSLDSARFFQLLQIKHAFNAYWGVTYAFLLSFLPLNNLTSWLQLHLLVAIEILASQILIYLSLVQLKIRKSIATLLCVIWGSTNYATGGGLFVTADCTLGLVASLYLFVAVKTYFNKRLLSTSYALLLGSLHGVAWATKTVALPGLMIFPVLIIFMEWIYPENEIWLKKANVIKAGKFIIAYLMPLLIVITLWSGLSYAKYGRVTLSESSTYTNALFIQGSQDLLKSKEKARHNLPVYGTYFWSDIALSFTDWDHKTHINIPKLIKRIFPNIVYFITSDQMINGCISILIIILSILSCIILATFNLKQYIFYYALTSISFIIILLYSCVTLNARYLPFAAIFALPACGAIIEHLLNTKWEATKYVVYVTLILALMHGISSMIYSSFILSPGGEHFSIAKALKQKYLDEKSHGPIGAFLGKTPFLCHHAVISYILDVQTAEIRPVEGKIASYTATFSPKYILLSVSPSTKAPFEITVNSQNYFKIISEVWGKKSKKTQLIVYK